MSILSSLIIFASLTAPFSGSLEDDLGVALGTAGLTVSTAKFDPGIASYYRSGEFTLPIFESMYADLWRVPFVMEMHRKQFAVAEGRPGESLSVLGRMAGQGSRRELLGDPIAAIRESSSRPGALESVLNAMKQEGLIDGAIPPLTGVPEDVRTAAALLLSTARASVAFRRAAFAGVPDLAAAYAAALEGQGIGPDPLGTASYLRLARSVDLRYLYAAAQDLALAVQSAQATVRAVSPSTTYRWAVVTDWGRIVLTGGTADTHDGQATLLVIDTGGDDTYVNTVANQSASNWLSIGIDSDGKDAYLSNPDLRATRVAEYGARAGDRNRPGNGAARFGFAFLVDNRGDDLYRSHRPSFGSAVFGVAAQIDTEGADTYDTYGDSLAFAQFGLALLDDYAGNDTYDGFNQVQGVGLTLGVAALIDRRGDDRYLANDTVIDAPSPQSAEHNVSMAQGAGYGVRADYLTGHSLAGGVGVLYDLEGQDSYTCGVFGQGTGYWEGIGALWDGGGDDTYVGQWYVQGASAHFGIGYLDDEAGNDRYTAGLNMAQGAGHDFGPGYLLDRAGNDIYTAPNLSLGAGNDNGVGVLIDFEGDDSYQSQGTTLGRANEGRKSSLRERGFSLGLFMDLAGNDTFPTSAPWAKPGQRVVEWTSRGPTPTESQLGIFWDKAGR